MTANGDESVWFGERSAEIAAEEDQNPETEVDQQWFDGLEFQPTAAGRPPDADRNLDAYRTVDTAEPSVESLDISVTSSVGAGESTTNAEETTPRTEPEVDPENEPEVDSGTGAEAESEPEVDSGTEIEPEPEVDSEAGAEADLEPEADPETEIDLEAEVDSENETEMGVDFETIPTDTGAGEPTDSEGGSFYRSAGADTEPETTTGSGETEPTTDGETPSGESDETATRDEGGFVGWLKSLFA